ncbi:ATP-binding protein [Geobacter pickeringii]|uniref:ATP-binding protein n=1 Tax=Geobacter pickeringii TaxID=345632 RepID=UPI00068AD561|nr:ATP-binding protein [Geobacter pickeringii]
MNAETRSTPLVTTPPGAIACIRDSFRTKLFLVTASVVIVVSTLFTGFFITHYYQAEQDKLVTEGKLLARLLANHARVALFAGNVEQLREIAEGAMSTPELLTVTIFDRDNHPLVTLARQSDAATGGGGATAPGEATAGEPGMRRVGRRIEFSEAVSGSDKATHESDLFFETKGTGGGLAPLGTVRVAMDEEPLHQRLRNMIATAALAAAAFLAAASLAVYGVIRGITRPLTHLAQGVRAVEAGEMTSIPVESTDEIGALAASFNRMVDAVWQRRREREEAAREIAELNARLELRVKERTAQLEEANRELESFNYSASHDLRAPLMRLNGFCQALDEDFGPQLNGEGRDYLRRIRGVSGQMERVIAAMATLFRVQRRELAPREIDLSAVVRTIAASLEEGEPERRMDVSVEPEVTVCADMELIWVAMENLVGNAWKFTARAERGKISFGRAWRGGETVCYLRDNGAGFNMAYSNKLFQPFQRLHGPDEFPGTGVGLAIVQRVISRHRGRIWLESEEGRGTTCYFTLPPCPEKCADSHPDGACL